jgi:hypothetical protein
MFNRWFRTIRIATGSVLAAVIVSSSGCRLTPGPQEGLYESNALEPLPSPLLQARSLTHPSRAGDEFHNEARALEIANVDPLAFVAGEPEFSGSVSKIVEAELLP